MFYLNFNLFPSTFNSIFFILLSAYIYFKIIPRARMGSESTAHEAEGRMGYWLRGQEGGKIIVLVKSH